MTTNSIERIPIPFILRNTKIQNYSQVISELKKIQRKNKKYSVSCKSLFPKVLKEKLSDFNIFHLVNGFVHSKLKEKQTKWEKEVDKSFYKDIRKCLEGIKKDNEVFSLTTNKIIGNIKEFETWFKEGPNDLLFNNVMLYDLHTFLSNARSTEDFDQEIAYLGIEYFKYIERFLKECGTKVGNGLSSGLGFKSGLSKDSSKDSNDSDKHKSTINAHKQSTNSTHVHNSLSSIPQNLEQKISTFVRLKFNREDLHLDVFEDQYVFAEIYVYLRCGFTSPVYKIFDKYRSFFQSVDLDFKNHFTSWLVSKTRLPLPIRFSKDEDEFKNFLVSLMQNEIINSPIISSVEDFLWTNLIVLEQSSLKDLISKFEGYSSPKGLLLVYVLTKQYDKAMNYLLKMDIDVYPTYFLMQELAKKSKVTKSFVDLVFLIASKMEDTTNKAHLISSLADVVDNYYEIIPQMIIKTKQYDLLGPNYLDSQINSTVVDLLKKTNDRKQLLHVHHVIEDPHLLTGILIDVLIEGILTNSNVDEYLGMIHKLNVGGVKDSIGGSSTLRGSSTIGDNNLCNSTIGLGQYSNNTTSNTTNTFNNTQISRKLEVLKMFYFFTKTPDLVTLKRTSLFSLDFKLIEVKFVVEKILRMACEIIKKANDHEMAKKLFKIVGDLELSDGCIKFINRELILYI